MMFSMIHAFLDIFSHYAAKNMLNYFTLESTYFIISSLVTSLAKKVMFLVVFGLSI